MKLSLIIVNYNVKYFLEQCLISVERAIQKVDAEVLVVDNASSDGSVEMVRQKFPWVTLIANAGNGGFSKANNQGINASTGEYVLLLNPDTVVAEDTFTKCIRFMDEHKEAGALGVHMVDGRGNFLPESKRGLPTPSVAFYKTFGFSALFPKSKIFGQYHLGYLPEHETNEADILSGAYMFMRKSALDKTGLLDETFFMYGEDIDLSYRIVKAGYKNYYFADTTIIHYKGESTKKGSLNYVKVFYNAMLIFARKHFSSNQSGWFSAMIKLAIFFRGFLTVLANVFSSSYLFIIDTLLSFAGIYFIKTYWENMIKYSDNYYPVQFLFIVVPIYIFVWIVATFLSGGYDRPYRVWNILRGVLLGTLAIAAIYAFLPDSWRFSRAMILLGAAWTAFEMIVTRISYHLIKHQSLSIENENGKRTLIVGQPGECVRAERLLATTGAGNEVVGFVSEMEKLRTLSHVYGIGEIIFCSRYLKFSDIIDGIELAGNKLSYKILNEGAEVFVGSDSKNTAGDLYSFDHHFNISKGAGRRNKRVFDVMLSLLFIPLLPLNILLIRNAGKFISNWMNVFTGKKTWVGYAEVNNGQLPRIKTGIISVAEKFSDISLTSEEIAKLDTLYARNYRVQDDLSALLKSYRQLGK